MVRKEDRAPILFFMDKKSDTSRFRFFVRTHTSVRVVDEYERMLREVCAVRNPVLRGNADALQKAGRRYVREYAEGRSLREMGVWAYFSWKNALVHLLPEDMYHELRTSRNRDLITAKEQEIFRRASVAIIGLSVGSHAAATIALQGGADTMRLADPDTVSASNLNRLRAGIDAVGAPKTAVIAREIYEMNPYARLRLYPRGVTKKNILSFLTTPDRAGVVVEEIDDIMMKFSIRAAARRLRIPVISATDNGDGIILDVERYDVDPKTRMFNGRAAGITEEKCRTATPQELVGIIAELIDMKAITPRMMRSARQMGKTLYSWPQLGGAAQLAGCALAYAARMIVTGGPLRSGRTIVSFEKLFSHNRLI